MLGLTGNVAPRVILGATFDPSGSLFLIKEMRRYPVGELELAMVDGFRLAHSDLQRRLPDLLDDVQQALRDAEVVADHKRALDHVAASVGAGDLRWAMVGLRFVSGVDDEPDTENPLYNAAAWLSEAIEVAASLRTLDRVLADCGRYGIDRRASM